jgi:inosine-uridine preferring nucleoside hydrolase
MKRKIIIDCDPGIDDSLALIYAIQHPDLEVVALTIVAGNVPVDLGVENAFKILEKLNRLDIPVYAGAEKPLVRDFVSAQDTHGMDGLGESGINRTSNCQPQPQKASEFLATYFHRRLRTLP